MKNKIRIYTIYLSRFINPPHKAKPHYTWLYAFIMLFLIFIHGENLNALTPVIIDESTQSINLGRYMEILEDPAGNLTIDDVTGPEMKNKWFRSDWDVPNFGFTRSAYWLRLSLNNAGVCDKYRLELSWHLLDEVKLYYLNKDNSFFKLIKGNNIPGNPEENVSRSFIFDIPFFDKSQYVYIRVKSYYTIQLPVKIWMIDRYSIHEKNEIFIMGGFVGILIVMILYNLFLFISIRDKSYFFYIFYISSQLSYNLIYSGVGAEFFRMHYPAFTIIGFPVSETFIAISALLFVINFLNTAKVEPVVHRIFIIIIFLSILNLIPPFVGFGSVSVVIQNSFVIIASILIIIVSARLSFVSRPARIFFISWTILLSGTIIVILKNYGLIQSNSFTNNCFYLATVLETVLLSFALADRINVIKMEKDKAQNEVLRIQNEATEILELKVSERTSDLAAANEKLMELDRVKTDFFANISHELRTPLTLILTPIGDALSGRNLSRENLEMMHRNSLNLLSLINDLLDISRITAGKMKLNVSETDISELIKGFCSEIVSTVKIKGIELLCISEEPAIVFVDREKIQHVISNFFSNSLKFTAAGGRINISVKNENNWCIIEFSDTGCGIPADNVSAIFDRFTQTDTSYTRHYEGTGIGLSIVKEFVELHEGEVSVKSRHSGEYPDNHGTVFTVKLPRGREHFAERIDVAFTDEDCECGGSLPHIRGIEIIQETREVAEAGVYEDDTSAILVVEDNADLRRLLVNMLHGRYIVYEAANGNDAVRILEDIEEIDLVLSDIMMPGMDGHELIRRIRSDVRFESLPVIFLTARADSFMKIEGLDLGATDYVTKPFNHGELLLRIRNQVELKRLHNSVMRNYNRLIEKLKSVNKRNINSENASTIDSICEFIKENYMEELSRENLAETLGIKPDTFGRLFNQHTGKTLNEYINEIRISEARQKLEDTNHTVTRISIDVGFDNIRTFNRVFKKITSMSPVEYREKTLLRN